ncbi:MAG: HPF/RaiA family ribosome-associated protein [Paucibacter sp.]|nr:HPF/RaiA family ribosome-associated protein [Roseateles sp.]
MQVHFESKDADALALREIATERLRFAMRRVALNVPLARVQLSDVNGPRGGIDKRCTLELRTHGAGTLVIVATARAWRAAFEAALTRAAHALVKAWQRGRSHPRGDKRLQQVTAASIER